MTVEHDYWIHTTIADLAVELRRPTATAAIVLQIYFTHTCHFGMSLSTPLYRVLLNTDSLHVACEISLS